MNRFLDFLNNADAAALTAAGANRELAEQIIAARPFGTEEDALKVEGVDAETLAQWRESAQAQDKKSGEAAIVSVKQEARPAVDEKKPSAQSAPKSGDSFSHRLGQALRAFGIALLKLIQLAALIGTIAIALYYGLPYLRQNFIVPVERNAAQIDALYAQNATQEAANATSRAEIQNLQAQANELGARVATLDDLVNSQATALAQLEAAQATLDAQMQGNNNVVLAELRHEVAFTRALDVLARGRLYLAQSNFGLAKEDLQSARDALADLQSEKDDAALAQAIARLDLALSNLPDFPIVASGDLEIAWQILMSGKPIAASTPTPTIIPTETPTVESTPTP